MIRVYDKGTILVSWRQSIPVQASMFSGIQEILLILIIVTAIFLLPRMIKPRQTPQPVMLRRPAFRLSWPLRAAIVLSVIWPAACALYFKPWQQAIVPFAAIGIGPVVVGWSLNWIVSGMRNRR